MIDPQLRRVALLVAGCFFMENLDGTIVTTAAPRIGLALHVAPSQVGLVITAYLMTLAVIIPFGGWMTARFGTRPVFLSAIVIFTLASLGCAISGSLGELLAMRVLQGVGGAMMVPVGRLVVLARTAKADLIRIISYIVWPGLVAPVIAPLAGGLLITYASWRWIFLINVPLGAVAVAFAWRLVRQNDSASPYRLDWLGLLLTGAGLAGITYAAQLLSRTGGSPASGLVLLAASLVVIAAAARHLLDTPVPLLNLRVLRISTLRASIGGMSVFSITAGAMPFMLPLLFQERFGWSPVKSGAMVLGVFAGNIMIKPATRFLLNRFGFRANLLASAIALAATTAAAGLLTSTTPLVVVAALVLLCGVARSIGMTAYTTMSFSDVPDEQLRDANTLAATAQQLSAGFGVAAAAVALRIGGTLHGTLPSSVLPAGAFTPAFVLLALVAVGGAVGASRIHPASGDALLDSGARSGGSRVTAQR